MNHHPIAWLSVPWSAFIVSLAADWLPVVQLGAGVFSIVASIVVIKRALRK